MRALMLVVLGIGLFLGACAPEAERRGAPVDYKALADIVDDDEPKDSKADWRKDRYIPVEEAVARLQAHIDVPVLLPRGTVALRNYQGWLADPKYINWWRHEGEVVGSLELRKNNQILNFNFGYAGFDGCGGDTAIETNVNGQRALIQISARYEWSQLVWPVTENGSSGRYGVSGTFEGWELVDIAEKMDAELAALDEDVGC